MLEADYIYLHALYESGDPVRMKGALAEIFRCQKEDGSWSLFPGGPGNISLAVKCYFAAKLMGMQLQVETTALTIVSFTSSGLEMLFSVTVM